MNKLTKEELKDLIVKKIPHPDQLTEWDMDTGKAIRFTWRGDRFRVSGYLSVEQVFKVGLLTTNTAILLENILKIP